MYGKLKRQGNKYIIKYNIYKVIKLVEQKVERLYKMIFEG
jgi:hypothetical protein